MKKVFLALSTMALVLGLGACKTGDKTSSKTSGKTSGSGAVTSSTGSSASGSSASGSSSSDAWDNKYTVTELPDWIQNDGCVIFGWVWSPSDAGSWKSLSIDTTTATFEVTEELTGFLLVRCAAGTETPNWSEAGDVAGRIYNKTSDIVCTADVHSYVCSEWVEFHPGA